MPRGMHPHRYKQKVEKTMSPGEFQHSLREAQRLRRKRRLLLGEDPRFKDVNIPALLSMLYYTGLRITEITGDPPHKYQLKDGSVKTTEEIQGLVKESIELKGEFLSIHASEVRKGGERYSPLWIPLDRPGATDILELWENTEEGERLFPISRSFAWKLLKELGDLYPHYFRMNRATKFAEHPETSIKDLQDWFGWKGLETPSKYMAKGGRRTKKMAERM